MTYSPRNILVTGGAGFIGSHFIKHILHCSKEIKIVNYDALTYAGSTHNLTEIENHRCYNFIYGNICNNSKVSDVLQRFEIDTIIHFAAESHVDQSIATPAKFIETNINGTQILLDSAYHFWRERFSLSESLCRFYHISTDEVFGSLDINSPPSTENDRYAPNSPYSASKAAADHLVRAYHKTYQLPTLLSYCSNNYGPHQHPEKLTPTIIKHLIAGQPVPIYGNGSNLRDWLFVKDHCHAIEKILHHGRPSESYNISANCELTNVQLVKTIHRILKQCVPNLPSSKNIIKYIKDRPGHDFRYAINPEKLHHEISWLPKTSLEAGLEITIDYYLQQMVPA